MKKIHIHDILKWQHLLLYGLSCSVISLSKEQLYHQIMQLTFTDLVFLFTMKWFWVSDNGYGQKAKQMCISKYMIFPIVNWTITFWLEIAIQSENWNACTQTFRVKRACTDACAHAHTINQNNVPVELEIPLVCDKPVTFCWLLFSIWRRKKCNNYLPGLVAGSPKSTQTVKRIHSCMRIHTQPK